MAELPRFFWDSAGHAHTNALHWEGFPRLLWESLQVFGYTKPPPYDGVEYDEEGVPRCRVKMTVPPRPTCRCLTGSPPRDIPKVVSFG
jgi:hypothetical protein